MIDFNSYQEKIISFMNPKVMENDQDILMNAVLGINGEAGEVADLIKKWLFHERELDLEKLDKEVGDVLFYCALYAHARKRLLSDIAQLNVDKLSVRYADGKWSAKANIAKADENIQFTNGTTTVTSNVEVQGVTQCQQK